VADAGIGKWGHRMARVRCVCGYECDIIVSRLRHGRAKQCGECARRAASLRMSENTKHGEASRTPEYYVWANMTRRCRDKSNEMYGGRGIDVCDRWLGTDGYKNFLYDMGRRPSRRHSLDRINNDLGYAPDNCRWTTSSVQQRNKRTSIALTVDGISRPLAEWAEITGQSTRTLYRRYYHGWTHAQIVRGKAGDP
jgi:hypothetical protein